MKGRVYEIVCNKTGKVYIGSTRVSLSVRLCVHRYYYKRYKEGNHKWMPSFDVWEGEDYEIHSLEEIEFEKNSELIEREKYYIRSRDCVNAYLKKDINEVIQCPCEGHYQYKQRKKHFNSHKHQRHENPDMDEIIEGLEGMGIRPEDLPDRPARHEREHCAPSALVHVASI